MIAGLIAGFGLGFGSGVLLIYLLSVKKLINDIRTMRYQGFLTQLPMPEPPKTVPLPYIRED